MAAGSRFVTPYANVLGLAGKPVPGALLNFYVTQSNVRASTYSDTLLTTPNQNPVPADASGTFPAIFLDPAITYKVICTYPPVGGLSAVQIYYADPVTAGTELAQLAAPDGAGLVGSKSGSTATTVAAKLGETLNAALDFGCDHTGATNTTASLLAFYNACISSGLGGHIPAGTYKITTGVLVFDNNNANRVWPNITTDGYFAVTFQIDVATETNAPVLTWRNGTATSPVGNYWSGGSHGGVTVVGSGTGAAYTGQHHFSFTGTWGIKFGWLRSNACKGNSFDCPQALYAGNNPDPYANTFLHFDGLESNFAAGFGVHNANYVGMDSWEVDNWRVIQPGLGAWFGIGSGNIINNGSVANVTGWVFDDGCYVTNIGGGGQRNYFTIMEVDNCQYGLRLNNISRTKFIGVRFPTRFQTTPNTSPVYWPITYVDLAGGASPGVNMMHLDIQARVEAGGVLANFGTFLNGNNNGNITDLRVELDYLDNAPLGLTNANFLPTNLPQSVTALITRRTYELADQRDKPMVDANGSAATTVPNAGFGTSASQIAFPTVRFPAYTTDYNPTTSTFTAPRAGLYKVYAAMPMALPIGTQVRIGFATTSAIECTKYRYSVNAGVQTYEASGTVVLAAGDTVYVTAVQNSATASVPCSVVSNVDEVQFAVHAL